MLHGVISAVAELMVSMFAPPTDPPVAGIQCCNGIYGGNGKKGGHPSRVTESLGLMEESMV
jgi:hypothetical protein